MKKQGWFYLLLLVAAVGIGGCSSERAKPPTEIHVSAAASLTDALQNIGTKYEAENPSVKIIYNFGSSGALQTQIEQGAPADVFVSAAPKQMDALEEKGLLLEGTRHDLLANEVVLIVPKDSPLDISSLSELAGTAVEKIALGEPKGVPVGQYAGQIFKSLGIEVAVASKAVYASDVRQVLAWVEAGEADCGLVYATDAAVSDKVRVLLTAPLGSHKEVVYPVAVLRAAQQEPAAREFAEYLDREPAKNIFKEYGFTVK
jgi:molybdate transport system substrate-binding protein